MTPAARLEQILQQQIPIAREMGITVAAYDGRQLRLAAPLAPNVNDKATAFGGSLYSLAVLCGWGLLRLKLEEAGQQKNLVIHEASIRYLKPVTQELQAECSLTPEAEAEFMQALQQRSRARTTLTVIIRQQGEAAVEFTGRYVAHE